MCGTVSTFARQIKEGKEKERRFWEVRVGVFLAHRVASRRGADHSTKPWLHH